MVFTTINIKKCLLGFLCLTSSCGVYCGRMISDADTMVGYHPNFGTLYSYGGYYPQDTSPISGYYGTPIVGGYYGESPLPTPSPSPSSSPKKDSGSDNNLALGLGLGLGLGVPTVVSGVVYWLYKHPSMLPWMWRPL